MGDRIAEVSETHYEGDYSNPPSPTENFSSASEELVISRPPPTMQCQHRNQLIKRQLRWVYRPYIINYTVHINMPDKQKEFKLTC